MHFDELKAGVIIRGPALPEPIQIIAMVRLSEMYKVDGRGPDESSSHWSLPSGQLDVIAALPKQK